MKKKGNQESKKREIEDSGLSSLVIHHLSLVIIP